MAKSARNYTKPELRERIKKKVMAGSKGGKPGQWSARKAQLVAAEYKAEGGGYAGAKEENQKHLDQWTKEEWTTADHKKARRRVNGKETMDRYLPKKAWDELTPEQKEKTRKKKQKGSAKGKQFVSNTGAAKKARKKASKKTSGKRTSTNKSASKKTASKKSASKKTTKKKSGRKASAKSRR